MKKFVSAAMSMLIAASMLPAAAYASETTTVYEESFESFDTSDLPTGWGADGSKTLPTNEDLTPEVKAYNGCYALQVPDTGATNTDKYITKTYSEGLTGKIVSVWMFDDMNSNTAVINIGSNLYFGMRTASNITNSGNYYWYRNDSKATLGNVLTNAARTYGWHKFTVDMTDISSVSLKVDDTVVKSGIDLSSATSNDTIKLGRPGGWPNGSSQMYIDYLTVGTETESFESGIPTDWTVGNGITVKSFKPDFGSYAIQIPTGVNSTYLSKTYTDLSGKVVNVWMFDDMNGNTAVINVGATAWLGMRTSSSLTNSGIYYWSRNGNSGNGSFNSDAARTYGWHKFTVDMTDISSVSLKVDDTVVQSGIDLSNDSDKNRIRLGTGWSNSSSQMYIDYLTVGTETESFENGTGDWTVGNGITRATLPPTVTAHTGKQALKIGNVTAVKLTAADISEVTSLSGKKVSAWIYDDMSATAQALIQLVPASGSSIMLGINQGNSNSNTTASSKYAYRFATSGKTQDTNIDRKAGWHKFTVDFSSSGKAALYIDGIRATDSDLDADGSSYTSIVLGSFWATGNTSNNVYIDDLTIEAVEEEAAADIEMTKAGAELADEADQSKGYNVGFYYDGEAQNLSGIKSIKVTNGSDTVYGGLPIDNVFENFSGNVMYVLQLNNVPASVYESVKAYFSPAEAVSVE